jgi:sarcosine oxidase
MIHDVAIIGLGVNGAAAAYETAARGARVVAIDRFTPPHAFGSSHGRTRITREAYFEHPLYVPLVREAYGKWQQLERAARTRLFIRCGGVMSGPPDGVLIGGSLASAQAHAVPHELLEPAALRERFPALSADPHHVALFEPNAGLLLAERCVAALLDGARAQGAVLRTGETVTGIDAGDGGVTIRTERGTIRAASAVVAAGAWLPDLLGTAAPPVTIERQVFHWYAPQRNAEWYRADAMPLGLWEYEPGAIVATFPDVGDGVKIGVHHRGEMTTARDIDRAPRADDERAARPLLSRYLGEPEWRALDASVCMYTNTPDEHFVIDAHPDSKRVVVFSACSGHGFKFAPATAARVADLALEGETTHDITPFRLSRFREARPTAEV